MKEFFVMRRANDDLFVQRVGDIIRIPVWQSEEHALKCKARNSELVVYWPVPLKKQYLDRTAATIKDQKIIECFLVSERSPDASLADGACMSGEALFSSTEDGREHASPDHQQD
jgi:hypothetical protein